MNGHTQSNPEVALHILDEAYRSQQLVKREREKETTHVGVA